LSQPLPNGHNSLMMSLTKVVVRQLEKEEQHFNVPLPKKFDTLLEREARFFKDAYGVNCETPLLHNLENKQFCGLEFSLTLDVFTPRDSSQVLVEVARTFLPDLPTSPRFLDLGTGSGCLLLSLLHHCHDSHAFGVGIDNNPAALTCASTNASTLHLQDRTTFVEENILNPMTWSKVWCGVPFDLVLCNPPYLSEWRAKQLHMGIHEPKAAVVAGKSGYEVYEMLAKRLHHDFILKSQGKLVLEVGNGMMPKVRRIFEGKGWITCAEKEDSQGFMRCLVLQQK